MIRRAAEVCAVVAFAVAAAASAPARSATSGFVPVSFTAVSEHDFWLLGTVPCGRSTCWAIRRTTDGGRTFARLAAPALPKRNSAEPVLRFADHSDGFAFLPGYAGAYRETSDGGATWRRVYVGSVLAFATGGGRKLVVSATCTRAACRGYRLRIGRVSARGFASKPLPFTPDGSILDLAAHGSHLWLLGTRAGGRRDALARSSDGGRTFATGRGPCVPGLGGDLEPVSPSVVWATCPTGMMAGAWRSTDGGRTFRSLATPPLVNSAWLAPASATVAVLLRNGPRTPLLRTSDGGRTWRRVSAPPPSGYAPFAGFTDARVGYVLVQTGWDARTKRELQQLWRTADSGLRWYRVVP